MIITKTITTKVIIANATGADFTDGKFAIPHGLGVAPDTYDISGHSPDTQGVDGVGSPSGGFSKDADDTNVYAVYANGVNTDGTFTFQATVTTAEIA